MSTAEEYCYEYYYPYYPYYPYIIPYYCPQYYWCPDEELSIYPDIKIRRKNVCHGCNGKGWVKVKKNAVKCPVCDGTGKYIPDKSKEKDDK